MDPTVAGLHAYDKKSRAKHACRVCNSRRVRCNVTEIYPCSNCETAGTKCEVLPSKRGRYPRKKTRQNKHTGSGGQDSEAEAEAASVAHSPHSTTLSHSHVESLDPVSPSGRDANLAAGPAPDPGTDLGGENANRTSYKSPSSTSTPGNLFFGESNFLTLVPGRPQANGERSSQGREHGQKTRFVFPTPSTPQSQTGGASPASIAHLSAGTTRYLRDEGALTFPDPKTYLPALEAYFTWFHPCFPVLDHADFAQQVSTSVVSPMLLQAVLFIGATYCGDDTIAMMGFKDRSEAKSLLYTRARLLFHADWEKDEITLLQSLFLLSFWRGGPSDVRDVRYWLGVVISLAESYGYHRLTKFSTRDVKRSRLRRRLWWSIYVRERQSAVSLGLPSRIRDEDCDIEPLSPTDLESEQLTPEALSFGVYTAEHVVYATKMVEIARLLGRIIDLHYVPGKLPSTSEQVKSLDTSLEAWKKSLPDDVREDADEGGSSVWASLLHLSYNHLKILIHRDDFLGSVAPEPGSKIVVTAACRISRIAEDMLSQGTLRYGQMHLITSVFAALCIHVICIRRGADVSRRIAETRAQICLLGLKEIQKYWRININVLDLFLQYLDESIAKRLHGDQHETSLHSSTILDAANPVDSVIDTSDSGARAPTSDAEPDNLAQVRPHESYEDPYFALLNGWGGDHSLADIGLFLQSDDFMQAEGLTFLERSL
ncbi:Cutinase transcription factor 1 alpha like protein [Verticillium longisporum]|uniref:Cutinase transcription factor 1 alpha like protein n=1 Tax=Verticillium longisporum TaxID=100787 RepID=A0A8I3APP2_VERLO|nr:Cutinase transcription factor 1 alpha like protein [Verticillium longisporum]